MSERIRSVLADAYWQAARAAHAGEAIRARLSSTSQQLQDRLTGDSFDLPQKPIIVVGAGKAVSAMAAAFEEVVDGHCRGVVVTKEGHLSLPAPQSIRVLEAAHPVPDGRGLQAAQQIEQVLETTDADDLVVCLLTGGASALLVAPTAGLTLEDKQSVTESLLRGGADIAEINTVRKHLSRLKGGGLAAAAAPARVLTYAVSDVLGDDPATIGSGPTVADHSTFADALEIVQRYCAAVPPAVITRLRAGCEREAQNKSGARKLDGHFELVANPQLAATVAAQALAPHANRVHTLSEPMKGDVTLEAQRLRQALSQLSPGDALVAFGEPTVVVRGSGRGGRAQQLALELGCLLSEGEPTSVLVAGTDGTDGPTDAAGAFADEHTVVRAHAAGYDTGAALADNDSYPLHAACDNLFRTGPTDTNVLDLVLAIRPPVTT